eukprot:4526971-Prymnesium_polylepis.1
MASNLCPCRPRCQACGWPRRELGRPPEPPERLECQLIPSHLIQYGLCLCHHELQSFLECLE